MSAHHAPRRLAFVAAVAIGLFGAGGGALAASGELNQPVDFIHNVVDAPAPVTARSSAPTAR